MRRKVEHVVEVEGRDKGKVFLITEMSAADGEDWALRALRLAQRSGADIPGGLSAGIAGIAAVGILTVLGGSDSVDELRPLLQEMMTCVQVVTDRKTGFTRPLVESDENDDNNDIQEIGTRVRLRKEWLDLHMDFSIADALSKLTSKTAPAT